MRIGVLGTGQVGRAVATGLVRAGHEVVMGSRSGSSDAAAEWVAGSGGRGSQGTFAQAAQAGEVIFNCTPGEVSLAALEAAGDANLQGKVLVDVSNPLDFSAGFPPRLGVCNDDSCAERIQRAHPAARVVKAFNTINISVMTNPGVLSGPHELLICGDDAEAKRTVVGLAGDLGWPAESVLDLGDLSNARGTEMYLPLWIRLVRALGTPTFNIHLVRA